MNYIYWLYIYIWTVQPRNDTPKHFETEIFHSNWENKTPTETELTIYKPNSGSHLDIFLSFEKQNVASHTIHAYKSFLSFSHKLFASLPFYAGLAPLLTNDTLQTPSYFLQYILCETCAFFLVNIALAIVKFFTNNNWADTLTNILH